MNPTNFPAGNTDDSILSGPKRQIYEPPSPRIAYPPSVNHNDQENTNNTRFNRSDLDRRPIINGHVNTETVPAVYPPNIAENNKYTEESRSHSPQESFDLMMFSEDQVRYPPIAHKVCSLSFDIQLQNQFCNHIILSISQSRLRVEGDTVK